MLDPSGCFFSTVPEKWSACGARIETKIAGLVVNTIAHKLYVKVPLELHTHKSCVRLLANDHRCKVGKLIRLTPFRTFKASNKVYLSCKRDADMGIKFQPNKNNGRHLKVDPLDFRSLSLKTTFERLPLFRLGWNIAHVTENEDTRNICLIRRLKTYEMVLNVSIYRLCTDG